MRTLVAAVLTALVSTLLGFTVSAGPAQAIVDRDCSDFGTQAQAQAFFISAGGPSRDPHRLDGSDNDGIACESLPCPCSTRTGGGTQQPLADLPQTARIVRVVDGDTVVVRLPSGAQPKVRLIGIDAPEVASRECGNGRATASLRELAPRGLRVRLVRDSHQPNTDRYGRLLRYVVRARDGKDLDRAQVARGWATVMVVGRGFERETRYRSEQRAARTHHRGVWGLCS